MLFQIVVESSLLIGTGTSTQCFSHKHENISLVYLQHQTYIGTPYSPCCCTFKAKGEKRTYGFMELKIRVFFFTLLLETRNVTWERSSVM
jgi:hypothetical protein